MYYQELTLAGRLQSYAPETGVWPSHRDTLLHPTASALIGIIACSQGIKKGTEECERLKRILNFQTSVLDEVSILEDYQIVTPIEPGKSAKDSEVYMVNGKKKPASKSSYQITNCFIMDAEFSVLVGCENIEELEKMHYYLRHPKWVYYLGKSCCTPSKPLVGAEFKTTDLEEWKEKIKNYICI